MVGLPEGVVIRDGVWCGCGPRHGRFARCVGSESPEAEKYGYFGSKAARPKKAKRLPERQKHRTIFSIPLDTVKARRKRVTITKADTDNCPNCTVIHLAPRYCDRHRELAVQNVIRAVSKDVDAMRCGSLLLMMADRYGIDLTD